MVDLEGLTRRELQSLAKEHDVMANLKSSELVAQLKIKLQQFELTPCDREGTASEPSTPEPVPCSSSFAPHDLKTQSQRVISDLCDANDQDDWLDSAKKEMVHLDSIWEKVLTSPNRKYFGVPETVDYKKKALSLNRAGFTVPPSPLPLKKYRQRDKTPTVAGEGKADGEEKENATLCSKKFSGKRKTEDAVRKLKSTSKIAKQSKAQVTSKRMLLAEQRFKSRLLKAKSRNK
ncbi:hypothetical protein A3770_02p17860 [Chloropicon primus]|uniref:Uncharacterized protein n=1 Tax=Chloropicon primus TaxID=1764295 RepID=A0A5B8MF48_9CHLO|nr:hypothetical protein A3770_02p17860 [Chloropicon primus]|eukprot:QDZ19268.1 hypothetical protein A3770_02p17860 [Chloropicon primus]